MSLFTLKNKLIIITGASSGIGKECAITCSNLDANVVLIGRDLDRLRLTHSQLKEGEHSYYSINITNYEKLENLIINIVEKYGKISGFIHSAGMELSLPLKSMKPDLYEKLFSINVIAGFELVKHIISKKNINEQGASILFISSIMSELGQPAKTGYCASKGALVAGAKALALELASKKIRVNSISPGVVETPLIKEMFKNIPKESQETIINMHPLGIGTPEDISYACAFLLSDWAKWITGTNIIIDGGYSAK